jgi:hypothetical protein
MCKVSLTDPFDLLSERERARVYGSAPPRRVD